MGLSLSPRRAQKVSGSPATNALQNPLTCQTHPMHQPPSIGKLQPPCRECPSQPLHPPGDASASQGLQSGRAAALARGAGPLGATHHALITVLQGAHHGCFVPLLLLLFPGGLLPLSELLFVQGELDGVGSRFGPEVVHASLQPLQSERVEELGVKLEIQTPN